MFKAEGDGVKAAFSSKECELLRRTIDEYVSLLDSHQHDDIKERLFPDASKDPGIAGDYRELTSGALENEKREAAEIALDSLGRAGRWHGTVRPEQQDAWLRLLTDLRLSIGTRVGVTEDLMEIEPDPLNPDHWPLAVLHYLGWIQETLIRSMEPSYPERFDQ